MEISWVFDRYLLTSRGELGFSWCFSMSKSNMINTGQHGHHFIFKTFFADLCKTFFADLSYKYWIRFTTLVMTKNYWYAFSFLFCIGCFTMNQKVFNVQCAYMITLISSNVHQWCLSFNQVTYLSTFVFICFSQILSLASL